MPSTATLRRAIATATTPEDFTAAAEALRAQVADARKAKAARAARRKAMGYVDPDPYPTLTPPIPDHPKLGEASSAKLDFLRAGEHRSVGVNRRHCRPLHPHGIRLVQDGLMTLHRTGTGSSNHSYLTITDKGRAELARLRKRLKLKEPT